MLSKPRYGWTDITIGEFKGRASYLTDVPMDCLIAFINALEHYIPASIFFNEEGTEFTLVSSVNGTYIISEREKTELISINTRFLKLAREIINDIETNLEDWVLWDYEHEFEEDPKAFLDKRRSLMKEKLERLKELVFEKSANN